MKHYILVLFVFITAFSFSCSKASLDVVRVEGGQVEGVVEEGIRVFRGIPFAAPPVGDLRWKAPQPVLPWDGILQADKFAAACPQMGFPVPNAPKLETSEDCLYLNVWTPAQKAGEKLPVMVWIYGGGFAMGATSSPIYSGEQLAKMGVIVVSVAYRVGPLGFLAHPELSAESANHVSGNYGLLDQIAGLRWVQNNIAAFGGDPAKVTIFGESAGAISVSILCASPLCKGLFSGAISESGGSFGPVREERGSDGIQPLAAAERTGMGFAERMGAQSIAELRKVSPDEWQQDPGAQMGGFWPNVDGYVIADDQYKLYEQGRFNDINVVIGTNSDEGSMFSRPAASVEEYQQGVRERFGLFADRILEAYPAGTIEETYYSASDIFRETAFAWPSYAWAQLQSAKGKSNVYVYYFDQPQPASPFMQAKPRGSAHASEMAYVFRHLSPAQSNPGDAGLSEIMAKYWTNFAKTGNPNGENLPSWETYSQNNPFVLLLRDTPQKIDLPNRDKLLLMEEYFKYLREKH
ncbi:MAG: carboxylesterase family protein [Tannerellaceae bacterium]|jgi:para-nitrobenzyl esterase|nr:carboxylesterase family protein [Tannerellaceae bacterium]